MRNLLFVLFAMLILCACQDFKSDYHLEKRGVIEKIENQEIAYVNDIAYSVERGVYDFFLRENLAVGDTVNVYANGDDIFVLTKLDYEQVIPIAQKVDWVFASAFQHPWKWLLFVVLVTSIFFGLLAIYSDFSFAACFKMFLGFVAAFSLVYVLCLPTFEYKQKVRLEKVSENEVIMQNKVYSMDNVYHFDNLRAQTTYLMYASGNKVYFVEPSFFTSQNPEILAKAINREIRFYALLTLYISSVWLIFLYGPWCEIVHRREKRNFLSSMES